MPKLEVAGGFGKERTLVLEIAKFNKKCYKSYMIFC